MGKLRLEIKDLEKNPIHIHGRFIKSIKFTGIIFIKGDPINFSTFSVFFDDDIKPKIVTFDKNSWDVNGYTFNPDKIDIENKTNRIYIQFKTIKENLPEFNIYLYYELTQIQ